jgi:hypothetical protein
MKSLEVLTTPEQISAWLLGAWKTQEFKTAHQNTYSFLQPIVKKFCDHPRFIIQMSDPYLERAHFTPWFNLLTLREYENPYIHDLFLLHEITHMVTLTYQVEDFVPWTKKMFENEMTASLFTEVEIYDHLPIRDKTFAEPIWWDTLPNEYSYEDLVKWRIAAMERPQNNIEEVISHYGVNNLKWAQIWQANYLVIEQHMKNFYSINNKTEQVKSHLLWLQLHQTDNILFKQEASEFAPIYWHKT